MMLICVSFPLAESTLNERKRGEVKEEDGGCISYMNDVLEKAEG